MSKGFFSDRYKSAMCTHIRSDITTNNRVLDDDLYSLKMVVDHLLEKGVEKFDEGTLKFFYGIPVKSVKDVLSQIKTKKGILGTERCITLYATDVDLEATTTVLRWILHKDQGDGVRASLSFMTEDGVVGAVVMSADNLKVFTLPEMSQAVLRETLEFGW